MKRIAVITSLIFCICLLQAQDFHFAYKMGNTGSDLGRDIAVGKFSSDNGDYFVTGTHTGTVDFDPSASVQTRTSAGMQDVFIAKYDSAGNLLWVTDFGGSLNDVPNAIVASSGYVYVTGLFRGTVDFDPGFGSASRTASGDTDIFLVKFHGTTGVFEWVVTMGGSGIGNSEAGIGLAIHTNAAIYLTGVFEGTNVNFNPNGTPSYLSAIGDMNIFIAKYSPASGILQWAKSIGSTTLDDPGGKGIIADANNVYVCGSFAGSCDFNPGIVGGTISSTGGQDGFIASYTAGGTYRWARRIGGPLNDDVTDIAMDESENLAVTGAVFGNVTYTGGSFTTSAGSQDILLASLTGNGTFLWAYPLGGPGANDIGYTVSKTDCGRIFVGGQFCSNADFNPGPGTAMLNGPACGFSPPAYSYFIASYDESGNYRWAKGGTSTGGNSLVRGLDIDICESLIATGSFSRTQDFDITPATQNLIPTGSTDAFVSKHFLNQITVSSDNRYYLAKAIICANNHKGRDSIVFCLPGSGPHVIDIGLGIGGQLPFVEDDYTIINGMSQPGWTMGNIELDGDYYDYGIRFDGCDHGEVIGLSIRNFSDHGIYAYNADHVTVRNCQVGDNGLDGIRFYNSAYGTVHGSIIGLNASATAADPNGRDGIATNGASDHLQVGGTTPDAMNYIAGNTRYGIYLRSDNCQVEGNGIGTNTLSAFGNGSHGIYISGDDNQVGNQNGNGTNYIAFNGGHGIEVLNSSNYVHNHFWENAFYCNSQSAIEINTANQGILPPTITLADASAIYGTGVPNGYVEIYAPDSFCLSNACQGRYFLGSANIDGAGNWSLGGSFTGGQQVLAIQTDANLNTSEFSNCVTIQTLLEAGALRLSGTSNPAGNQLLWEYNTLNQQAIFQVERSKDTSHWELIQSITAETGATWSQLTDRAPAPGFYYYRVGMRLEDGRMVYSNVVEVQQVATYDIRIYPNPAQGFFGIQTTEIIDRILINDISGRIVLEAVGLTPADKVDVSHLAPGMYMVRLKTQEREFALPLLLISDR